MGELEGKVAVITGAGSGMGRASVITFIREGARGVIAADVSGAEKDVAELSDAVVPFHCDVSKESDVEAMIHAAVEQFGKLDAVLNVAGIGFGKPLLETTQDDLSLVIDVMLRGMFLGTQHGIEAMLKTGGGSVVNWSSLAGVSAMTNLSAYSAAKAGVIALTKVAAIEHGRDGIRANAIVPGWILSEGMGQGMLQFMEEVENKVPLGRVGTPMEVAEVGAFLCSDRASYISGAIIPVDGAIGCQATPIGAA